MGFFDLNIPYEEHSSQSSSSSRTTRIKIVTKVMELGYSGIAYNRTIRGVMSDRDRCSIARLTLSSLLKVLPSLSASVEFHRDLLGIPRHTPFRQYTRLTICLDSPSEVLAVNYDNLILKTYDLISVKPLNQHAFDQACGTLKIDIITIDFAEKRAFRIKQPMVKRAIERGVYFEITYSNLISDVHERRQVISTAKLLVEWTQGKNLIISSAASSVNEIRGPYDVANLTSLLGLSMERAKAAVSKNCRTLIANALRKKQFHKEAIRVERMPSNEQKEPWSEDLFKWDPISSGEGDMILDDIAKSFAASNSESKAVKAIDFASIIDNMPPQGFLVKNMISGNESNLSLNDNGDLFHAADVIEPLAENGVTQQPHFETFNPPSDADKTSVVQEEAIEMDVDDVQAQNLSSSKELNEVMANEIVCSPTSTRDIVVVCDKTGDEKSFKMSENPDSPRNEVVLKKHFDILSDAEKISRDECLTNMVSENLENIPLAIDGTSMTEQCLLGERILEPVDVGVPEHQVSSLITSPMSNVKGDFSILSQQQTSEVQMEDQKCREADSQITHPRLDQSMSGVMSTGKSLATWRRHYRPAFVLPFKRVMNPMGFKKKAVKNMTKKEKARKAICCT